MRTTTDTLLWFKLSVILPLSHLVDLSKMTSPGMRPAMVYKGSNFPKEADNPKLVVIETVEVFASNV